MPPTAPEARDPAAPAASSTASPAQRRLAFQHVREARDRFSLGVANTVEVVQAEQQATAAESDYVSSLLSLDLARLNLSKAMGQAETSLPDLLRGRRP